MPYITTEEREILDGSLRDLLTEMRVGGWKPGHVAYVLYSIMLHAWADAPRFSTAAELLGAVQGCVDTFIVERLRPYEQTKKRENGDVRLFGRLH